MEEANKGRRNSARWAIALALGLRQCEALGLKRADVDLKAGVRRCGGVGIDRSTSGTARISRAGESPASARIVSWQGRSRHRLSRLQDAGPSVYPRS
jgi:integrase